MWRNERWPEWLAALHAARSAWRGLDAVIAVALLGVVTLGLLPWRAQLSTLNVAVTFLALVVLIPLFADRWTSVAAAVVAFLAFDFFFILPYNTLEVAAVDHVIALGAFLGAATLTSQLVYRARVRTVETLARARQMTILFELSQALIADINVAGALNAIVNRVASVFNVSSCAVLLADVDRQLVARAAAGPLPPLDDRDHAAIVAWVIEHVRPAGLGQRWGRSRRPRGARDPGSRRTLLPERTGSSLYVPIDVAGRAIGVLYVGHQQGRRFSENDQQLLLIVASQIALALERARLTEEVTHAAVLARSDGLKSALLSAVSHDLRTPLASIKASATSLLQRDIVWSPEDQRDLLQAIDEETDRLTRLVENLLDLSRIEAGKLAPRREWNDLEEAVRDAVSRARSALPAHVIEADVPADLPLVWFDYVEIAQVFDNLLENAGKHAPPGTPIEVEVRLAGDAVECSVADRGQGVPLGEEERVFDTFYRIERRGDARGVGVGLSVCRGIVEAHGGRIGVVTREAGGALFWFTLPLTAGARGARVVGEETR